MRGVSLGVGCEGFVAAIPEFWEGQVSESLRPPSCAVPNVCLFLDPFDPCSWVLICVAACLVLCQLGSIVVGCDVWEEGGWEGMGCIVCSVAVVVKVRRSSCCGIVFAVGSVARMGVVCTIVFGSNWT